MNDDENSEEFDSDASTAIIPDENSTYQTPEEADIQIVPRGKFKGIRDTRKQRCVDRSCRIRSDRNCKYCKVLPYVSSNLRQGAKSPESGLCNLQSQDHLFTTNASIENRLGNLLEELQRIQTEGENIVNRSEPSMNIWSSLGTLPLLRARERISRIKHRIWTKEDICHMESFFVRRSIKPFNRRFFTSKKPANSSSCS